jgi:hypothetical protein
MKKLFLALALSALSFSAVVAQNGMKSEDSELLASRRKSGNRTFGVGLNYSFPAPGISARFGFTDNLKGQLSMGWVSVGFGRLTSIGGEIDYAFDENRGGLGQWYPFAYGSLGSVTYNYSGLGLGDGYKYSFLGWNVGGGIELFPEFLGGDIGVNWKLGLGSVGNYGLGLASSSVATSFIWGGGIHYYFK